MNKFRDGEKQRLLELTQNAHKTKDELNDKLKVAGEIIQRGEICREAGNGTGKGFAILRKHTIRRSNQTRG